MHWVAAPTEVLNYIARIKKTHMTQEADGKPFSSFSRHKRTPHPSSCKNRMDSQWGPLCETVLNSGENYGERHREGDVLVLSPRPLPPSMIHFLCVEYWDKVSLFIRAKSEAAL